MIILVDRTEFVMDIGRFPASSEANCEQCWLAFLHISASCRGFAAVATCAMTLPFCLPWSTVSSGDAGLPLSRVAAVDMWRAPEPTGADGGTGLKQLRLAAVESLKTFNELGSEKVPK